MKARHDHDDAIDNLNHTIEENAIANSMRMSGLIALTHGMAVKSWVAIHQLGSGRSKTEPWMARHNHEVPPEVSEEIVGILRRRLGEYHEGDRVVVAVKRKEHGATIIHVGRVGFVVRIDDSDEELFRHPYEIFDIFNDGRKP